MTLVRRPVLAVLIVAPIGVLAVAMLTRSAYLDLAIGLVTVLVVAGIVLAVLQWRGGFRRFAAIVAALSLVAAGLVSAYLWTLNDALGDISRMVAPEVDEATRPAKAPNTSLNILLM